MKALKTILTALTVPPMVVTMTTTIDINQTANASWLMKTSAIYKNEKEAKR